MLEVERAKRVLLEYWAVYEQYLTHKGSVRENKGQEVPPSMAVIEMEGLLSPTLLIDYSSEVMEKAVSQHEQTQSLLDMRNDIFSQNLQGVLDRVRSQQKRIQLIKAQNKKEDMDEYIDRNRRDFQDNEISQEITDFLTMENIFKNEDEEQFQDEIDLQEVDTHIYIHIYRFRIYK